MANIRIKDLPSDGAPKQTDLIPIDLGSTRHATVKAVVESGRPTASKAEAEAGVEPQKAMTPLTTKQAIDAQVGAAYVPKTVKVNAGSGMTGGGELSGDVTVGLTVENVDRMTKVDGIEAGATKNETDAHLLARANHTGTQAISTVSGLQGALDGKLAIDGVAADSDKLGGETAQEWADKINVGGIYDTKAAAQEANIPSSVNAIRLNGGAALGDGNGGLYSTVNNGSTDVVVSGGRTFYRVKDVGRDRIPDNAISINKLDSAVRYQVETPFFRNIYKKRVFANIPIKQPDYDAILSIGGYSYIYPQSFIIDDSIGYREILISYQSVGGSNTQSWLSVFDLDTFAYKGSYGVGGASNEGFAIQFEGVDRYILMSDGGFVQGKYNVTTWPPNLSIITPTSSRPFPSGLQVSAHNDEWLVESYVAPVGGVVKRNIFTLLGNDTSPLRTVDFHLTESGFGTLTSSPYASFFPKRQAILHGGGFYCGSYGGIYRPGVTSLLPYNYQGIKVFNTNGDKILDGIINPEIMINILQANGVASTRVENEGICSTSDGRIFTLTPVLGSDDIRAESQGLIIFEEFSSSIDAVDFSSAATTYPMYNRASWETGVFPRSMNLGGSLPKMTNPVTGGNLDSLDKILDFMSAMEHRSFSWYTSSVTVTDLSGNPFPTSLLVTIKNANTNTFHIEHRSPTFVKSFVISGTSGSRVQAQLLYS